ncbi:MAG: tRNA uridine(34) 5-carboxymethylaminomethyl modification radical SAM/GNAT enzyme Elp3 [Eggerthellaceae bacterium]|nr:tRNA uridine(34) 5-carboxymethylaminomethyl modification radical SAM/GNAT enzyme Elp3 [Eggerthellaceae bacterium]
MEQAIRNILDALRVNDTLEAADLDRILRDRSAQEHDGRRRIAKKRILPYYLSVKQEDPDHWASWGVDDDLERRFIACVRMKPRRSASGVATITVITKPWPCRGSCIYCPNDVRMPKSYLHREPACQRAERCWFDPYLQVAARLNTLEQMGHATSKIELIVLGGTWLDYPESYRNWFVLRLFDALNDDAEKRMAALREIRASYVCLGLPQDNEAFENRVASIQQQVNDGAITYNRAIEMQYGKNPVFSALSEAQTATIEEVREAHKRNEDSDHRAVGLVFETRPDSIDARSLRTLRELGCTKIQLGVQSLDDDVLRSSTRGCSANEAKQAINLARLFGFKIHAHLMANLPKRTPEMDREEFERLISDTALRPDELKLYPCALVDGTGLMDLWRKGLWQPYTEDELVSLLADDVAAAPPYLRISRMIRDIGADDIVAGNKKANLRQMVEERLRASDAPMQEIRLREIGKDEPHLDQIRMDEYSYETDVSDEVFLQWIDNENRIYGFLRLSLPYQEAIAALGKDAPVRPDEAMIREVHVYGFAENIHAQGTSAQHLGLGRKLIERACELAQGAGYSRINVISAVGTRPYYRSLGFEDGTLYQIMSLK